MRVMAVRWDPELMQREQVLGELMQVVAGVEADSDKQCFVPSDAPSKFYGGEARVARKVLESVSSRVVLGCANDRFSAQCAARLAEDSQRQSLIIPRLENASFLSTVPVRFLENQGACEVLEGLGIHTLGQFAELTPQAVNIRFGSELAYLHQLVRGNDQRPMQMFKPRSVLRVSREFEHPSIHMEGVVQGSRFVVEQLCEDLEQAGVACLEIELTFETEHNEVSTNTWRAVTVFDVPSILDRVHWQLDQWVKDVESCPSGGVDKVHIEAIQVVSLDQLQSGLWGELSEGDQRAHKGIDRMRSLVGVEQVLQVETQGGRAPRERVVVAPKVKDISEKTPLSRPWPGHIPAPSPATVYSVPIVIDLLDAEGQPVAITDRGNLRGSPASLRRDGVRTPLAGWAGPWLTEGKWWDSQSSQSCAWFQVATADGAAYLCRVDHDGAVLEACYD